MTGYLLLVADLFLVALVLTVAGYLAVALARSPFSGRRPAPQADPVWRRCENCKHRWQGVPGHELGRPSLLFRRAVRRRARKRKRNVEWARAQGWSRCPSCLSRQVRDSRRPAGSDRQAM